MFALIGVFRNEEETFVSAAEGRPYGRYAAIATGWAFIRLNRATTPSTRAHQLV